jgi:pimeloyl-ACP methyl ester carboxylesterase
MYVKIGGIQQWLQVDTEEVSNPPLLFLHGGPGGSSWPAAAAWKTWQKYFTVVHWDQRGAGLTFGRNGAAQCGHLTIDRMITDGIEVVEFLRSYLGQEKIILAGHSWGSFLGVNMVKRRADLFSAYVGAGQLVNKKRNEEVNYERQLAQAEAAQNFAALAALRGIGPPPFDRKSQRTLRQWADHLARGSGDDVQVRPSPRPLDLTATDVESIKQGRAFSRDELFEELSNADLTPLGFVFEIPMFFFHGTADQQTPIELAQQYFDAITAPVKAFVRFEGCHHFVVFNRPDLFLNELLAKVRPVASTDFESVEPIN